MTNNEKLEEKVCEDGDRIKAYKISRDVMVGTFPGKKHNRRSTFYAIAETRKKEEIPYISEEWMTKVEAKKLIRCLTKLINHNEIKSK